MAENYKFAFELYKKVKELCRKDEYNLFLHKHLGDLVACVSITKQFELQFGKPLHIIIPKEFEILCNLFNVTNYSCLEGLNYFKKCINESPSKYLSGGSFNTTHAFDSLCKDVFISIPEVGEPFVIDSETHNFFLWDDYFSKFWAWNAGLTKDFYFSLPTASSIRKPCITTIKKLEAISPIESIVLIAPDASTATELPFSFWKKVIKILFNKGYTVVVNSKKYKFENTKSTFDLGLSLEEVIWLGYNCAYVFSIRSGLCDVLVGIGRKLFTFYPAMLKREIGSLNNCFLPAPEVNEILIDQWNISPCFFEGEALHVLLQPEINLIRREYCYHKVKAKFPGLSRGNRANAIWWRNVLNSVAGNGYTFPLNNKQLTFNEIKHINFLNVLFDFLAVAFCRSKKKIKKRNFRGNCKIL